MRTMSNSDFERHLYITSHQWEWIMLEHSPYQYFVISHSFLNVLYTRCLSGLHCVVTLHLTDFVEKITHNLPAIFCQVNFRVKLHTVKFLFFIANTWNIALCRAMIWFACPFQLGICEVGNSSTSSKMNQATQKKRAVFFPPAAVVKTWSVGFISITKLKAWLTTMAQPVETATDYRHTHNDLGLISWTDRQTDGHYQMFYLPCFAVNKKVHFTCNQFSWLSNDFEVLGRFVNTIAMC